MLATGEVDVLLRMCVSPDGTNVLTPPPSLDHVQLEFDTNH